MFGIFSKKITPDDLVKKFSAKYVIDADQGLKSIFSLIKGSPLVDGKTNVSPEFLTIIQAWLLAHQLIPVTNLFTEPDKTQIYNGCIFRAAEILDIEAEILISHCESYMDYFRSNYSPFVAGSWLVGQLFDKKINDPGLIAALSLYVTNTAFDWKSSMKN